MMHHRAGARFAHGAYFLTWPRAAAAPGSEPVRSFPGRTSLLVTVLAVCAAGCASAPGTQLSAGRFVDPRFGWIIKSPASMELGYFHSQGMFTTDGIRISNFTPALSGSGSPDMGWLRSFPPGGVALQLWFGERTPAVPPLRDSTLPLPPASFSPIRRYTGGQEPRPSYRAFYADGFAFSAAVWFGSRSSRSARQAIWAAVRSVRFPALRAGTIWQDHYYVLGPASQYKTGTVTTIPAASLPKSGALPRPAGFYLIHAPRAFYVITRLFQNPARPSSMYPVAFDPKASQFYSPGTGLRWDRTGQPIGAHAGQGPDWALQLHVATVAQDGHILFSPFFGGLLGIDLKGNPWGG